MPNYMPEFFFPHPIPFVLQSNHFWNFVLIIPLPFSSFIILICIPKGLLMI